MHYPQCLAGCSRAFADLSETKLTAAEGTLQRHTEACDPQAAAVCCKVPSADKHVGQWSSWPLPKEAEQSGLMMPQVLGNGTLS